MTEVTLLTGSNLGNPVRQLSDAFAAIENKIGNVIKFSEVYVSEAWGFASDDPFYNQALVCSTSLSPEEVLDAVWAIERELGKPRGSREEEIEKKRKIENGESSYESRTIDIDILFYGDLILDTKLLTIPHKLIETRSFVLKPLNDIMADYIHPVSRKSIRTLLNELE